MISLIWPYWQRQSVADRSLALLATHYADLNMEVIVVDDGSPDPFRLSAAMPFRVASIHLPKKSGPKNPCIPINVGVSAARGDVIALSGPDIFHPRPVLQGMLDDLIARGPDAYVMAACWMPEADRWVSHSSLKRRSDDDVGHVIPSNAGYHFMTMMHRSLWDASGGFDEDYREGCGYDDPDFVMRLQRAGAKFVMRDDLVVNHIRGAARAAWPASGYQRNRDLFLSKWSPPLRIAV